MLRSLVLVAVGLVAAVPVADSRTKTSSLATRGASECASGWLGLTGKSEDTDWCVSNCGVGFCPTDRCSCDGDVSAAAGLPVAADSAAEAPATAAAVPAPVVPAAVPAAIPAAAVPATIPAAAIPAAAIPAAAIPAAAIPAAAIPAAAVPVAAVPAAGAIPGEDDGKPAPVAPPLAGAIPGDGVSSPPDDMTILAKGVKVYKETMKGDKTGDSNLPFDKLFIAYWGAGPYTPFEEEKGATMGDALKQGYNVIAMSFADRFQLDGSFGIDTDMCPTNKDHSRMPKGVDAKTGLAVPHAHQCMPSKANVSTAAGISMDSWRYVLSFGGAAGPGPRMEDTEDETQQDTFVEGFVKTYLDFKKDYGFDGIDIDVESSINTPVLKTFRKIYKKLHEKGELISMAPETPSLVSRLASARVSVLPHPLPEWRSARFPCFCSRLMMSQASLWAPLVRRTLASSRSSRQVRQTATRPWSIPPSSTTSAGWHRKCTTMASRSRGTQSSTSNRCRPRPSLIGTARKSR